MTGNEQFNDSIGRWLEDAAPDRLPQRVLAATFERTRGTRQEIPWRAVLVRPRSVAAFGGAALAVVVAGLALNLAPFIGPAGTPEPSATPGLVSSCTETIQPSDDVVLGCSHDGARLLIQRGNENLYIVHANGSETQLTEQLTGITKLLGSSRPAGATISPDGSLVVFAGLTVSAEEASSCHDGALFTVDANGGPAELLWKSQVPQNGIVRYPAFSPDGRHIAFADGYCDSSHGVWVMNADGSDALQIVPTDFGPLGATHVHGLAWSLDGDRIALQIDDGVYGFGTDGSNFTRITDFSAFCWPGLRC